MRPGGQDIATVPRELFSRRGVKDGRLVVALSCQDSGQGFAIALDVYPVTGPALNPIPLGPHPFGTLDDAVGFVEEALLALEYLGCSIESGSDSRRAQAAIDDV